MALDKKVRKRISQDYRATIEAMDYIVRHPEHNLEIIAGNYLNYNYGRGMFDNVVPLHFSDSQGSFEYLREIRDNLERALIYGEVSQEFVEKFNAPQYLRNLVPELRPTPTKIYRFHKKRKK